MKYFKNSQTEKNILQVKQKGVHLSLKFIFIMVKASIKELRDIPEWQALALTLIMVVLQNSGKKIIVDVHKDLCWSLSYLW